MTTDEAIIAARHLTEPGWHPHEPPSKLGLDIRDWMECVRLLVARIDRLERTRKEKP